MCDASLLKEYGLIGSFDTVVNLLGERIAIVTKFVKENTQEEEDSEENDSNGEEDTKNDEGSETEELTTEGIMYAELQYNSMALATQLYYRFGVREGDRVLIACEGNTGAEIVSMIGCMRLGTVFVPVETSVLRILNSQIINGNYLSAKKKLSDIVSNIQPSAVILVAKDDNDEILKVFNSFSLYRCALLDFKGNLVEEDASVTSGLVGSIPDYNPNQDKDGNAVTSLSTLYILHTSGSTGESKAVMGSYRGLLNRISWQYNSFPYTFGETILRRTPLTFVDSLAEIFCPLLFGVPIVSQFYHSINQSGLLSVLLELNSAGITRITLIPSQLNSLLKSFDETKNSFESFWSSLQYIVISGEECPLELILLFRDKLPSCNLINIYGSTEISGDISYAVLHSAAGGSSGKDDDEEEVTTGGAEMETEISREARIQELENSHIIKGNNVTIGKSIANNCLFVVQFHPETKEMELLDGGSVGELLVIGSHVANGYYSNQSDLQQKDVREHRFIPNPFLSSEFIRKYKPFIKSEEEQLMLLSEPQAFRTGDLVIKDSENNYFYLGRKDRSIKIRGNKVELDTVEREVRNLFLLSDGIAVFYFHANELLASHSQTAESNEQVSYLILVIDENNTEAIESVLSPNGNNTQERNLESTKLSFRKYLQENLPSLFLPDCIYFFNFQHYRTSSFKVDRQKLLADSKKLLLQNRQQTQAGQNSVLSTENPHLREEEDSISLLKRMSGTEITDAIFSLYEKTLNQPLTSELEGNTKERLESINFFEFGGNSINSIEAIWKLKQFFHIPVITNYHLMLSLKDLSSYIFQAVHNGHEESDISSDLPPMKKLKTSESHNDSHETEEMERTFYQRNKDFTGIIEATINKQNQVQGKISPEISVSNSFSTGQELKLLWKCPMMKCIDATAVIGVVCSSSSNNENNNIAVIGSHGGDVICVNSTSGEIYWKTLFYEHIESAVVISLQNQKAYVTSFLGNDIDGFQTHGSSEETPLLGNIRCLSLANGEILWKYSTSGECKQSVCMDEKNNRLFSGDYNGVIYQLEMNSGRFINSLSSLNGSFYSNFCASADYNYLFAFTTRGYIYMIDSRPLQPEMMILYEWDYYQVPIFSTPVMKEGVNDDNKKCFNLWISFVNGEMINIKLSVSDDEHDQTEHSGNNTVTNELLWQKEVSVGSFFSSMTVIENTALSLEPMKASEVEKGWIGVIGCHDGILRVIQFVSGEILKEIPCGSVLFASPVCYASRTLNANPVNSFVACATTSGDLLVIKNALDLRTNNNDSVQIIKTRLPGEIFSSPVVFEDKIFVGCRDDNFYCFEIM
jgi:acyl-CoA synthetase (AMP-forming)/AMP-acid ligase II/outer membrane protein assembly factor BamB